MLSRRSIPRAPWVWKDPRHCLSFAFWRSVLDVRPIVVLVNRNPLEITASALRVRSEQGKIYALSLWERYMRQALGDVAGLPVLAVNYSDVLNAPLEWCLRAQASLVRVGVPAREPSAEEVAAFIDVDLRHAAFSTDDLVADPDVSTTQRALFSALEGLEGAHEEFSPPSLPAETPTTEALLAERRRGLAIKRELTRELERRSDWEARIRGRLRRVFPERR